MLFEVTLLIITFPFFASLALVNCLKSHWKFKGDDHESPLGSNYEFSDEEKRPGLQLLPSPAPDMVKKLKARVRRERRGKKSPQDYFMNNFQCNDEEDSLFNVPSLIHDQPTVKSPRSATVPVDIQDSRILRVNQDRLGYKKSHTIYATRTSVSPYSERMGRLSGSSSGSATDTEPATVIQNY
ncbi:hypothetical protein CRE_26356 [Caenorhabditis remanei]|uniref:Uncharacterized protein n=1 Tax=Caenorhabditis remanei TaxID=31234 RepID=E3LRK7_CAERE|nr:hypothetical protein CRE_26356 [Caenorhabditis remanei]